MTATTYTEADVLQLAATFSCLLEEETSGEQFADMIRRNAVETDPSICHSHDLCDANQVMLDAMELHGWEYGGGSSEENAFVSRAWDAAKRARFNVK